VKIKTAIVAGLLAMASLPLHAAAAAPVRMQVWEITRTSWAPSKLAVFLFSGYSDSRTINALTYLRRTSAGYTVLPGAHLTSHEGTSTPQVYAQGERVSCVTVSACSPTKGISYTIALYEDSGRNDPLAPDTVVAVTYGRDVKVTVDKNNARQWRVRRVNRAVRALWSSDSVKAAGVWSSDLGFEAFTDGSVKGGPRGSVAIGVPPCSGTPVGAAAGVGTVTLAGGVAPVEATCPADTMRPSQVARKATTWTFSGPVAGLTAEMVSEPGTVRLLVVDF